LTGRLKIRRENNIKEYFKIMKISNWTKYTWDRVKWKAVVEKAKTSK